MIGFDLVVGIGVVDEFAKLVTLFLDGSVHTVVINLQRTDVSLGRIVKRVAELSPVELLRDVGSDNTQLGDGIAVDLNAIISGVEVASIVRAGLGAVSISGTFEDGGAVDFEVKVFDNPRPRGIVEIFAAITSAFE